MDLNEIYYFFKSKEHLRKKLHLLNINYFKTIFLFG